MTTVKQHLISSKELTPIYTLENLCEVRTNISRGNWIGVIEKRSDRLKIISTAGEGWIKYDDAEETDKFSFKVFHDENGMVQYGVN